MCLVNKTFNLEICYFQIELKCNPKRVVYPYFVYIEF